MKQHEDPDQIPEQSFVEGRDYYFNEKGLITFTAFYLSNRGYCCGSGCRHCPYGYEAVPEPRRSWLRNQQNKEPGHE